MAARKIPRRSRGTSGTPPVMSWVELARAMNGARGSDDAWERLRPAALRSLERSDSRIDSAQAAQLFDAMRRFTPGGPPANVNDNDER